MRILVTGGAGFIGSHIVEQFHDRAEVRVLDDLRTGRYENIEEFNVNMIRGSILDTELLEAAMDRVDYVFHLAAMISVPESIGNPIECVRINSEGTLAVLEAATRAGVKKLCFSSSAAVYGDNPAVPKLETMLPEPKSPYAVTKLDGEFYCRMYTDGGRLPTACLRYFNVFGPRQNLNGQYAAAVPIFVNKAVRNEAVTIFGDGEQTRDFIFVKDIVAANQHLMMSNCTGVYNVAYGGRMTIIELARRIIELTGSTSRINYAEPRPGDIKHSMAAIERLLATGFSIGSDFESGLGKTIEYFHNNA